MYSMAQKRRRMLAANAVEKKRTPYSRKRVSGGQALRPMEHRNKVSSTFRGKNYSTTVLLGMSSTFRVFIDTTNMLIVAPPRARRVHSAPPYR